MTHKVLYAVIFGLLGQRKRSMLQILLLCGLQAVFILYLSAWRPFVDRHRQIMELVCHGVELILFLCALALIDTMPDNHAKTTFLMIGKLAVVSMYGAMALDSMYFETNWQI